MPSEIFIFFLKFLTGVDFLSALFFFDGAVRLCSLHFSYWKTNAACWVICSRVIKSVCSRWSHERKLTLFSVFRLIETSQILFRVVNPFRCPITCICLSLTGNAMLISAISFHVMQAYGNRIISFSRLAYINFPSSEEDLRAAVAPSVHCRTSLYFRIFPRLPDLLKRSKFKSRSP